MQKQLTSFIKEHGSLLKEILAIPSRFELKLDFRDEYTTLVYVDESGEEIIHTGTDKEICLFVHHALKVRSLRLENNHNYQNEEV
jgi:hypothetical protein